MPPAIQPLEKSAVRAAVKNVKEADYLIAWLEERQDAALFIGNVTKVANGKPRLLVVTKYRVATFGFRQFQTPKFYEFELLQLLLIQCERDEGTWMFDGNTGINVKSSELRQARARRLDPRQSAWDRPTLASLRPPRASRATRRTRRTRLSRASPTGGARDAARARADLALPRQAPRTLAAAAVELAVDGRRPRRLVPRHGLLQGGFPPSPLPPHPAHPPPAGRGAPAGRATHASSAVPLLPQAWLAHMSYSGGAAGAAAGAAASVAAVASVLGSGAKDPAKEAEHRRRLGAFMENLIGRPVARDRVLDLSYCTELGAADFHAVALTLRDTSMFSGLRGMPHLGLAPTAAPRRQSAPPRARSACACAAPPLRSARPAAPRQRGHALRARAHLGDPRTPHALGGAA